MEILTHEKIRQEGLPGRAHVVELVGDRSECALHPHFAGMECVPVGDLNMVRERIATLEDPILIHSAQAERYNLAAAELDRMGYKHLFRYEGSLEELESAVGAAPEFKAQVVSGDEVEGLLKSRPDRVHLINVVADASRCEPPTMGVTCLEPANLEEQGLKDLNRDDTIVLRCDTGIDCNALARTTNQVGFNDVRIFEGDYRDLRWLERM